MQDSYPRKSRSAPSGQNSPVQGKGSNYSSRRKNSRKSASAAAAARVLEKKASRNPARKSTNRTSNTRAPNLDAKQKKNERSGGKRRTRGTAKTNSDSLKKDGDHRQTRQRSHGIKSDELSFSFHRLCRAGNEPATVRMLLKDRIPDIEARDKSGRTPLYWAMMGDSLENLQSLLDAKADTTTADDEGHTLLHHAAQKKDDVALDLLLRFVSCAVVLRLFARLHATGTNMIPIPTLSIVTFAIPHLLQTRWVAGRKLQRE